MNLPKRFTPPVLLAVALSSTPALQAADWAQALTPLEIKTLPADLSVQPQNPPTFSWSRHSTNPPAYVIEVIDSKGRIYATYTSFRNWYLPSKALPPDTYTWHVRPSTLATWSADRKFVISAQSNTYEVGENTDLRARVIARARPRALQSGMPLYANWTAAMLADRGAAVVQLKKEVDWNITAVPVITDALWPLNTTTVLTAAQAAQVADIRKQLGTRKRQLESASLLFRLTADPKYLTEALRRGDEMAAFNPLGPTNYAQQDQAPYAIASTLVHAYDALYASLDTTRRAAWLKSVAAYGNQIYTDLSKDNGRIDQYPFDSHGISNTAGLALLSTLGLGDVPDANAWFDFSFRSYVSSLSVWSGPEGGFANGSAYAEYAVDLYMQVYQPALQAMGLDLYAKPWSRGFMNFFTYFVPPGQKSHVFGDGHEVLPSAQIMKAYAVNFATPSAAWYANNIPGTFDALTLLRAPYPLPSALVPPAPPAVNSIMLPSIGWAALHSSLADPLRTSVYFKSSPYGSYNHSHGDQNSVVVMSAGQPLLAEGGWYDYYGSPMWMSWYRATKSHNALTYDGGLGQVVNGDNMVSLTNNGKITGFSTTASLDYVEGDATPAYGGALSSAVRKVWYLRSIDAVVIQDKFKSPVAHTFEWNFHAFAPLVADTTEAGIPAQSIRYQGRQLCVRPVSGSGLKFTQPTNLLQMAGRTETQGIFSLTAPVTAGEFLMVLDVGCKHPTVALTTGTTRTLTVGGVSITLPN